ncbi:hypothetical protein B0T26DRAFT_427733 [Lasiosphaeria miniovina]|uniref:Uncharacterized protein n=1 Tax=Lasiosphaeria miniovina TaxID=1954250 RepID=A0AA40A619_9PEZI|nr:uncharacterized protein B0T26DRAFT_427733 [Lasiosphaeria miniovina]KAK0709875.1 hypothetical protein B0T26DRAFT_427733 [Lasiosphaeria miniovina]
MPALIQCQCDGLACSRVQVGSPSTMAVKVNLHLARRPDLVRNYQIPPDLLRTLSRCPAFVRRLITRDSTTCFSVPPHRPCSTATGPCSIKVRPGARRQVTAVGLVSRRPARFSGLANLIPGPAPWPPRGSCSVTTAPISPVAADWCDRDLVSVWARLERVQERRVQQAWKHGGLGYWLQQVGCRPGRVTVTVNHFAGTELENYSGCSALAGPPPGRWFAISARLPFLLCHVNLGVALDIRSGKRALEECRGLPFQWILESGGHSTPCDARYYKGKNTDDPLQSPKLPSASGSAGELDWPPVVCLNVADNRPGVAPYSISAPFDVGRPWSKTTTGSPLGSAVFVVRCSHPRAGDYAHRRGSTHQAHAGTARDDGQPTCKKQSASHTGLLS